MWSPEKNRLAFMDGIHGSDGGECSEAYANLAVIDARTGGTTSVPLAGTPFVEVMTSPQSGELNDCEPPQGDQCVSLS